MSSSCNIFETALYRATDNKMYQILSLDSDTVLMSNASENIFFVAIKPFIDDVENVIDFSSVYHFNSIENATDFRQRITEHLNKIENVKLAPLEQKKKQTHTVLAVKKGKSL